MACSTMDPKKLYEWCRIPADQLENHPDSKIKLKIFENKADAPVEVGNMMADEVIANNKAGKPRNGCCRQDLWGSMLLLLRELIKSVSA